MAYISGQTKGSRRASADVWGDGGMRPAARNSRHVGADGLPCLSWDNLAGGNRHDARDPASFLIGLFYRPGTTGPRRA